MDKPTFNDITNLRKDDFAEELVTIKTYRRKVDNNVFFIPDDEDIVLDAYMELHDINGVVYASRHRTAAEKLGAFLRKGATAVLGGIGAGGMHLGVLQALMRIVSGDKSKAVKVIESVRKAQKPGLLPQAIIDLLTAVGPGNWRKSLNNLTDKLMNVPPQDVEKALIQVAGEKLADLVDDGIKKLQK